MADYEEALKEGKFDEADETLTQYLNIKPDDWEITANHGALLLIHGKFIEARSLYARLMTRSPLKSDFDIQFESALSHLPRITNTKEKSSEILEQFEKYIPALAGRGLLEGSDFEQANTDLNLALQESALLEKNGDIYQRYQSLLNLLVVSLCRSTQPFKTTIPIAFEHYPKNLVGDELLLYGIDTTIPIDYCATISIDTDLIIDYDYDLIGILHAIKAFNHIRAGNMDEAALSIAQSQSKESNALNSFLEGLVLAHFGSFVAAEVSILRTGYTDNLQLINTHGVIKLLTGPKGFDEAETIVNNALRLYPNDFQALNNAGVIDLIYGRIGKAQTHLEIILNNNNTYKYATYNMGIAQLVGGDPERAISLFSTVNEKSELFPGISYYSALAYQSLNNIERANSLFKVATKQPGVGVLANLALAESFSTEEIGYKTAIEFYEKALDIEPNNYIAELNLVLLTSKLGDIELALVNLNQIAEKYTDITEKEKANFHKLYTAIRAEIYHFLGREDAESLLAEALTLTDDDIELYKHLVVLYNEELLVKDKIRDALSLTRTALATDSDSIPLLLARTKALIAANDLDSAFAMITDAEAIDPSDVDVLVAKARLFSKDQRWDEATDIYLNVYALQPNNISSLEEALVMLKKIGGHEVRIDELEDQILRAASLPESSVGTSFTLQAKDLSDTQIKAVEAEIKEVTRLLIGDTIEKFSGYLYRGFLFSELGNYKSALDDYKEASLHIDKASKPETVYQLWQRLTEIYLLFGDFEKAKESIDKVFENNPPEKERGNLLITHAGIYEKLGIVDVAIDDYTNIISDFPNYFLPYFRRCLIYLDINEVELAIEDCSTAIRIEPKNVNAYRARHTAYGLAGNTASAAKDKKTITLLSN